MASAERKQSLHTSATVGWLCVAALFVVGTAFVGYTMYRWRKPAIQEWRQVTVGMEEVDVTRLLGPALFAYTQPDVPDDYYIDGYGYRERAVSHRVLIYMGRDMVFYVWLSPENRVEDTFRAGS